MWMCQNPRICLEELYVWGLSFARMAIFLWTQALIHKGWHWWQSTFTEVGKGERPVKVPLSERGYIVKTQWRRNRYSGYNNIARRTLLLWCNIDLWYELIENKTNRQKFMIDPQNFADLSYIRSWEKCLSRNIYSNLRYSFYHSWLSIITLTRWKLFSSLLTL